MAQARKECKDCRRRRALSAFRLIRQKGRRDRYYPRCRDCERRYQFGHNLKRYGLTVRDFALIERAQRYTCGICPEPLGPSPHVDHCHSTGKVRGLLCGPCNTGIGHLKDDIGRLRAAIEYLAA